MPCATLSIVTTIIDRTDRVDLTKKRLEALHQERLRTQLGSIALINAAANTPPELTYSTIEAWITGNVQSVPRQLYEFVIEAYRAQPDGIPNTRRPLEKDGQRIPITDEMRIRLRLLNHAAPERFLEDLPIKFSGSQLCFAMNGRMKTISRDIWACLDAEAAKLLDT